jgi:hypothetical protein
MSYGKILDEMSLNKFVTSCGICFADAACNNTTEKFLVNKKLILNSHFGNAINLLGLDMSYSVYLKRILTNGIRALPSQVAQKHLEKLHKILYAYIYAKYIPTSKTSVTCPIGCSLLELCCSVYQKFSSCELKSPKAANIEEFPGSYHNLPETTMEVILIKSKFDEFHCTGFYVAPGALARLTVLEGNWTGWDVRIGAHTDDLTDMKILNRWPNICCKIKLKKHTNISSAFGGTIYLDSPKGNSTLKIKLENVIEIPYYDLNKAETIKNWNKNSNSPGLWAELCGKYICFTVPSNTIRHLNDPFEGLMFWDSIVAANHELRGTDVKNTWRQRIVIDAQPYNSKMHSGYPIVIPFGNFSLFLLCFLINFIIIHFKLE